MLNTPETACGHSGFLRVVGHDDVFARSDGVGGCGGCGERTEEAGKERSHIFLKLVYVEKRMQSIEEVRWYLRRGYTRWNRSGWRSEKKLRQLSKLWRSRASTDWLLAKLYHAVRWLSECTYCIPYNQSAINMKSRQRVNYCNSSRWSNCYRRWKLRNSERWRHFELHYSLANHFLL